jgi:hypothetical protein
MLIVLAATFSVVAWNSRAKAIGLTTAGVKLVMDQYSVKLLGNDLLLGEIPFSTIKSITNYTTMGRASESAGVGILNQASGERAVSLRLVIAREHEKNVKWPTEWHCSRMENAADGSYFQLELPSIFGGQMRAIRLLLKRHITPSS